MELGPFQSALKLALAISLSYWFTLWMDWDYSKYSALAIVLISLDTTKASLQKGLLRVIGTVAGVAVGFCFVSLFSQERLLMLVTQSLYLLFIAFMMQRSRAPYAWFVAGFVPFLVWSYSYMNVNEAFYYGIYRLLETVTGIVIYTLVCVLFGSNEKSFDQYPPSEHTFNLVRQFNQSLLVSLTYVVAFIFWVVTDPPSGAGVVAQTAVFSLVVLLNDIEPGKLLIALLISLWAFVAPFYFLLMPLMSSGIELITAIFLYTFLFGYLGTLSPVLKLAPIAMLIMTTGISNEQSYSFIGFVNGSMAIILSTSIITVIRLLFIPPKFFDKLEAQSL